MKWHKVPLSTDKIAPGTFEYWWNDTKYLWVLVECRLLGRCHRIYCWRSCSIPEWPLHRSLSRFQPPDHQKSGCCGSLGCYGYWWGYQIEHFGRCRCVPEDLSADKRDNNDDKDNGSATAKRSLVPYMLSASMYYKHKARGSCLMYGITFSIFTRIHAGTDSISYACPYAWADKLIKIMLRVTECERLLDGRKGANKLQKNRSSKKSSPLS